MLNFDQIKKNYPAEIVRKNPRAILVEYLQYELLDSIFKQKGSENLSFIGGTAIRIVHQSTRFSEDLDFDNFALSFMEFEKLLDKVLLDMSNKGFTLEFRLVEKGAYYCYIKFPEILRANNLPSQPGKKILVRIDALRKQKFIESSKYLLDGFGVYRMILVNPIEIILAQKMYTILERKREKGRDFYDVSYLLGRAKPNFDYLQRQYKISPGHFIELFKEKISKMNYSELVKDVLPFLMNPDDQARVKSFCQYIEQVDLEK